MSFNKSTLIKKYRCHCHHCRGSMWNDRTKKWYTKGSNSYKDFMHKLRVRKIRRQKHNEDIKLISVGYTD